MKKILLFLLLFPSFAAAQNGEGYLWPIEGAEAGTGILYAPQNYIGDELNFDNLFIGAPEGTVVVSPCDGTISGISLGYLRSLVYSMSYGMNASETFDEAIARVAKDLPSSIDPQYVRGSISIMTADGSGNVIYINGLTSDLRFKTGQKVKKGEPLGQVGYSYHKIKEPSIDLSISKHSKASDPMTPFGLKTSFVAPAEIKPIVSVTKEQALEDFTIYIDALKEAYPGLYHVVTADELEQYVNAATARIESAEGDLPYDDFRAIMRRTIEKIHDSHIYMYPPVWGNTYPDYQPAIWFGSLNGGPLICTNATKEYEHFLEREIVAVNGIPADSVKTIITSLVSGYDAKVESSKEMQLATTGFGKFFIKPYGDSNFDMSVEFADGQTVDIKGESIRKGWMWVNNMRDFAMRNRRQEAYETKMLNDSTAYLGLSTFSLTQVQVDEVGSFIDSLSADHLIIDVRNNPGGQDEPLAAVYSFVAGEPMTLGGYGKVNKRGGFDVAKYSLNYTPEMEIFPADYVAEEGKEGFYKRPADGITFMPDSLRNYKGKVYVLTNENSISAASLFTALVVRNHRGVTVGRETCNAYHFMNAIKFMDVRLPNSTITVRIPLEEVVFDTKVNERVPFGRGVLPDYGVSVTMEELFGGEDAILNRALALIESGEYLSGENPFAEPEQKPTVVRHILYYALWVGIALAVIIILISASKRKRRKK